jgi:hypothetical protein
VERRIELAAGGVVSAAVDRPASFRPGRTPAVLLAPGAGTDLHHALLATVAQRLAEAGFLSVRFNFPYRESGRRAPDPAAVLEHCYRTVLQAVAEDATLAPPWIAIGGKSMGGRIASHLAASGAPVRALVLLGYPLHPAGKPHVLRAAHLPAIGVPTLFVQGTRDPLAPLAHLRPLVSRMRCATLHTVDGADHSLVLPRRMGRAPADVWGELAQVLADWLAALGGRPY